MDSLTDFMCVCSDTERNKSEACYQRVLQALDATPENLLSKVVYDLQWGYQDDESYAFITSIACDQWCGIRAKVEGPKQADIYVQCDVVEHGIARVWEMAKGLS